MTHKFNLTAARKYSVMYQLFNLILIGFFGLVVLLSTLRFESFQGMQGSGLAIGIALDKWQVASLIFVLLMPLLIAYLFAPGLFNHVSRNNRYMAGILFTFACWFPPLVLVQTLDGMNSFREIWQSVMPAAMAAVMFGPLLGRKIFELKEKTAD